MFPCVISLLLLKSKMMEFHHFEYLYGNIFFNRMHFGQAKWANLKLLKDSVVGDPLLKIPSDEEMKIQKCFP